MDNLFKSATGGNSWEDVANELVMAGEVLYLIFLLYIAFFNFIVVNALCSIFVDFVRQCSEKDTNSIIHDELRRKDAFIDSLKSLYRRMNPNERGQVTQQEFLAHLKEPEMRAFASVLGIEPTDLDQFFSIISGEGSRPVDLETFVVGAIKLRGMARSMDVLDIVIAQRRGHLELHAFMTYCRRQFRFLRAEIAPKDFPRRVSSRQIPTTPARSCRSFSESSTRRGLEDNAENVSKHASVSERHTTRIVL
jgi:hypothetical protein